MLARQSPAGVPSAGDSEQIVVMLRRHPNHFPDLAFWQLAKGWENYTHNPNPVRVAPASVPDKRSEQWPVRAGMESPKRLPRHLVPPTMEQWCICHRWAAIEWARIATKRRQDHNDEEALVAVRIHRMEWTFVVADDGPLGVIKVREMFQNVWLNCHNSPALLKLRQAVWPHSHGR